MFLEETPLFVLCVAHADPNVDVLLPAVHHGHEAQLFNLEDDPGETKDLSGDSAFEGTKSELLDRVLDGWNPEWVKARMQILKHEQIVMEDWAANTDPDDVLRWNLRPQMDFLDKS